MDTKRQLKRERYRDVMTTMPSNGMQKATTRHVFST